MEKVSFCEWWRLVLLQHGGEEAGEALIEFGAAQRVEDFHAFPFAVDDAAFAQDAQMVVAGGEGDVAQSFRRFGTVHGAALRAAGQLPHERQAQGIAQGGEHLRQLELVE